MAEGRNEVLRAYVNLMGPELGSVFHALFDQCVWLHIKWLQYRTLFGEGPKRIKLLNATAGLFFWVVQDVFWGDTLLRLSRMTDKPVVSGRKNLTIRALPSLLKHPSLPPDAKSRIEDLLPDAQSLVDIALTKTEFARDWRNRKLAHTDLALAIEQGATPLTMASREKIVQAIDAIAAVLNRIERHFKDSTIHYGLMSHPSDAGALLYVLGDGLKAGKQRQARLEEGRPTGDDLRPPEPI